MTQAGVALPLELQPRGSHSLILCWEGSVPSQAAELLISCVTLSELF